MILTGNDLLLVFWVGVGDRISNIKPYCMSTPVIESVAGQMKSTFAD